MCNHLIMLPLSLSIPFYYALHHALRNIKTGFIKNYSCLDTHQFAFNGKYTHLLILIDLNMCVLQQYFMDGINSKQLHSLDFNHFLRTEIKL